MIIDITLQDIWNEFVYYCKSGLPEIAFKHIRTYQGTAEWEVIVAGIAHHNYKVNIGDMIRVEGSELEIVWDNFLDQMFNTVTDWSTPRKRIHSV